MKMLAMAAVAVALSGCATQRSVDASVAGKALEPVYCQGAEQCSFYWRRAQAWIATNSRWKIQVATDTVISTYTPTASSIDLGFQATRVPLSGGRELIEVKAACDNMFGCRPHQQAAIADLKTYIKSPN